MEEEEEEEGMSPLFMFLNSSLNVELVYIILKGITSFKYQNLENKDLPENMKRKKAKSKIEITEIGPNTMITLNQVKIKDLKSW